jgi:hypothetical protein
MHGLIPRLGENPKNRYTSNNTHYNENVMMFNGELAHQMKSACRQAYINQACTQTMNTVGAVGSNADAYMYLSLYMYSAYYIYIVYMYYVCTSI